MGESKFANRKWVVVRIIGIFLLIAATLPVSITSLSTGLDPSWIYLLNIAAERNWKFGSDLTFTYGPLGFLAHTLNIGRNAQTAIMFYGALTIVEIWLLWCAFRRLKGKYGFGQGIIFLLFMLISTPWMGKEYYVCFLFFLSISLAWTEQDSGRYLFVSSLLTIIAALMKFNAGVQCIATLVLFILGKIFMDRQTAWKYIPYLPTVAIAYIAAFLSYNPSFSAFLHYISTSLDVTSGYSEAMSLEPEPMALLFAVICGIAYCVLTLILFFVNRQSGIYMLLYSGALFQMFKHGFVRADGHIYVFFAGLLMICAVEVLFLNICKIQEILYRKQGMLSCCILLVIVTAALPLYKLNPSVQSIVKLYPAKANEVFHGIKANMNTPIMDVPDDTLPDDVLKIIGQDTVAVLPSELLIDAHNDINMVVMPALQSYEAYTATLDAESAEFFTGESAPEYIIFGFWTIDYRISLLETPAIWQAIYENYEAVLLSEPYLVLKKLSIPYQTILSEPEVQTVSSTEQIELPEETCYVKIDTKLTLWGGLNKFFYQIPPVTITLKYLNGAERSGRVLPDVLKNGVILSELPDSLMDMGRRVNGIDKGNRIVSFQLSGDGWRYYEKQMTVSIQEVQSKKETYSYDPLQMMEIYEVSDPTIGLRATDDAQLYCIDFVNEVPPMGVVQINNEGLRLRGWALDDELKCSPEAVYIKFDGKYYKMRQTNRKDVFDHFGGYSGEPLCGFDGWIPSDNVSSGNYPVSLVIICDRGVSYYETPDFLMVYVTD